VGNQTRISLWFYHYTNDACPRTFLSNIEAARAAGYKTKNELSLAQIGYQNSKKLSDKLNDWMDEVGLSDAVLKKKLLSLMEATETKFFQHEGVVTDQREVAAIETQRRTLDMALKVKDLYAPKKFEHTGKDQGPISVEAKVSLDLDAIKEAIDNE